MLEIRAVHVQYSKGSTFLQTCSWTVPSKCTSVCVKVDVWNWMFLKLTVRLVTLVPFDRFTPPTSVSFLYSSRHLEFQISLSSLDLITNDMNGEQTKTQESERGRVEEVSKRGGSEGGASLCLSHFDTY
jgi:hypothetical protein